MHKKKRISREIRYCSSNLLEEISSRREEREIRKDILEKGTRSRFTLYENQEKEVSLTCIENGTAREALLLHYQATALPGAARCQGLFYTVSARTDPRLYAHPHAAHA